ncbi:hypothetical protein PAAG_12067 [Paracoccidioides lutzii Pb01]|uniref:Uncharacterized protein n=1 Tax=Paracoccidioides lutzii (strain ATCC MYA-826 / Pb01) TaxID=502779 RepID=A0A0A2VK10_PARBA|nr:hypothetical protein PAAG_12067 [Paracoccidioides lutzii Pb01]KGQ01209.1 hypothetical protein PAAG_12067 [Paracoccidioides lutzii Pb01]
MEAGGFEYLLQEFPPEFECVRPLCRTIRDPKSLYNPVIKEYDDDDDDDDDDRLKLNKINVCTVMVNQKLQDTPLSPVDPPSEYNQPYLQILCGNDDFTTMPLLCLLLRLASRLAFGFLS